MSSLVRRTPFRSPLVPTHASLAASAELGPPYEVSPDDPRLPALQAEVEARLASVRDGMADAEFSRLVDDVARFHLRWLGTHT
jgi:hypothetical protein